MSPSRMGLEIPRAYRPGQIRGRYCLHTIFRIPSVWMLLSRSPCRLKSAVVMVPKVGVEVSGANITDGGDRDVQGVAFHLLTADNLAAGSALNLALNGTPGQSGSTSLINTGSTSSLVISLIVFLLVIGLAAVWLIKNPKRQVLALASEPPENGGSSPREKEDAGTLIDAIIALDDQYRAGKIPETAYRQRRQELKSRLAGIVGYAND